MFEKRFWVGKFGGKSCQEFTEVFHVCHIKNAIEIVRTGIIKSNPIKANESCLYNLKISTVWISPKEWFAGTAFGNVKFGINWESIVKGKHIYHVYDEEFLRTFRTPTYRLLFTNESYEEPEYLIDYNLNKDKGPLMFKNGKWYRNENNHGHFLIESNIALDMLTSIEFVDHPEKIECEQLCTEPRNMIRAGPAFLAALMGNNVKIRNRYFTKDESGVTKLTDPIDYALYTLQFALFNESDPMRTNILSSKSPYEIMRSCLLKYSELEYGRYANKKKNEDLYREIDKLLCLIGHKRKCQEIFNKLAYDYFGIDKGSFPPKSSRKS